MGDEETKEVAIGIVPAAAHEGGATVVNLAKARESLSNRRQTVHVCFDVVHEECQSIAARARGVARELQRMDRYGSSRSAELASAVALFELLEGQVRLVSAELLPELIAGLGPELGDSSTQKARQLLGAVEGPFWKLSKLHSQLALMGATNRLIAVLDAEVKRINQSVERIYRELEPISMQEPPFGYSPAGTQDDVPTQGV